MELLLHHADKGKAKAEKLLIYFSFIYAQHMIVGNRTPSYRIAADNITDQYHSETILGALYASG
jgi:hypothetical protein